MKHSQSKSPVPKSHVTKSGSVPGSAPPRTGKAQPKKRPRSPSLSLSPPPPKRRPSEADSAFGSEIWKLFGKDRNSYVARDVLSDDEDMEADADVLMREEMRRSVLTFLLHLGGLCRSYIHVIVPGSRSAKTRWRSKKRSVTKKRSAGGGANAICASVRAYESASFCIVNASVMPYCHCRCIVHPRTSYPCVCLCSLLHTVSRIVHSKGPARHLLFALGCFFLFLNFYLDATRYQGLHACYHHHHYTVFGLARMRSDTPSLTTPYIYIYVTLRSLRFSALLTFLFCTHPPYVGLLTVFATMLSCHSHTNHVFYLHGTSSRGERRNEGTKERKTLSTSYRNRFRHHGDMQTQTRIKVPHGC